MTALQQPAPRRGRRAFWAGFSGLVAALALILSACGTTSSTTSPGGSASGSGTPTATVTCPSSATVATWHLVAPGKLTVVSDTTYAPAEFQDPNNPSQFIGYDMDLIREIARRLCLTADIQKAD